MAVREKASGLQSLASMAQVLAQLHALDDIVETAADHACLALDAATVSISRVEAGQDQVRTVINAGDLAEGEERWPRDEVYPITGDRRLSSAMNELGSWVDVVDSQECDPQERELLLRLGKGCSLATAIVVDREPWGEFYATRHIGQEPFDDESVAYCSVLVAIVASAISRVVREAALEELAFHDPLTGLFNRRALDEHAERIFDLGADEFREVAIVALDIDGLKHVNDTRGHASGDAEIRAVATCLSEAFAPYRSSVVARVGGDEFTVIVSGRDVSAVELTVNDVCAEVSTSDSAVGVSAGIAAALLTRDSPVSSTDLFAAADRAQYVAKRAGLRSAVIADEFSV